MKVIWEAADIKPGRSYGLPGSSETWRIALSFFGHKENLYIAFSESDGSASKAMAPSELAYMLTEKGCLPIELLNQ